MITQDTINLLPNIKDLGALQRSDIYVCVLIFIAFLVAGTMQFKMILGLTLSLKSFTMPLVMASLISVITTKLRVMHRVLKHERDQHEFVRAQVQHLNHRLRDHLDERTQLLISAREQVALTQSRADQGVMASGVVHDINNALMTIAMSWELLKEVPQDELNERRELSTSLDYALHQAREITSEFKFMLRTDRRPVVDLVEHLKHLYSFLSRSMNPGQRLTLYWSEADGRSSLRERLDQFTEPTEGPPDLPLSSQVSERLALWVPLSEGQATQIVMNLVFNARDALIADQGDIIIHISADEFNAAIEVIDNGSGMPHEVRDQIFTPFYTTKRVGEGTGLGLHVIRELVERAHGAIEVESELNVGTRFTVSLPLVSPSASPTSDVD